MFTGFTLALASARHAAPRASVFLRTTATLKIRAIATSVGRGRRVIETENVIHAPHYRCWMKPPDEAAFACKSTPSSTRSAKEGAQHP